ncbi:TIGR03943 family putative permease subunit [Cohnella hashimotonis]|uniref:TIGR03943 family protein n=1 Tax=Cohnella hashimotonis TaxID=2826895 RepID=A0ABT6TGT0_9BACL|nr:TIGR03943 family protein [Cohnella hashimotonis]MDI4646053.1 TIGR03943 family protein [Cohnella hashimotonis]
MIRFAILFGLAFMFLLLHRTGDLDKYINMKYAYLSVSAIVLLALLSLYQFVKVYRAERKSEEAAAKTALAEHDHSHDHDYDHDHHNHDHHNHDHHHDHHDYDHHDHDGHSGHSHVGRTKWRRGFTYLVLAVPIFTGIFLPVATLDSSFVKAKGFSFPELDQRRKDAGYHQFLRPDTSVFYSTENYDKVKQKDMADFAAQSSVELNDTNYLKGMEVLYNYADEFADKTITFDGFAYKGDEVGASSYFVFRFGFIHCVADSGVFGMLVQMPAGTKLSDDDWLRVTGKLTREYYQPFKQMIPVLKVKEWARIDKPDDPYVYRNF